MESVAKLIEALASLAWPVAAGILLLKLFPVVREIMSSRAFTLKVAGFELSAKEVVEGLKEQIEDLQNRLKELEDSAPASVPDPAQPLADRGDNTFALEAASGSKVSRDMARRSLRILWVDDKPRNNAFLIERFSNEGHSIETALSTAEGVKALASGSYDLAITDMGREESGQYRPDAGLAFAREARETAPTMRLALFCHRDHIKRLDERQTAGFDLAVNSPSRLTRYVETLAGEAQP